MQLVTSTQDVFKPVSNGNEITLSIIVPAYNEASMLPTFHYELSKALCSPVLSSTCSTIRN